MAKPKDLEKRIDEARKSYPAAAKEFSDPKQCDMVGAWLGMAIGAISVDEALARNPGIASNVEKFKEGMGRLRQDAATNPSVLAPFKALAVMCDHPNIENYLKIAVMNHGKTSERVRSVQTPLYRNCRVRH